jgi:hypothetical protein
MKLITFNASVDEKNSVHVAQTPEGYLVSFAGASITIGAHLFKQGELQFLMYGKQYESEAIGIVSQREYVDSRDGLTILAQHGLTDGLGWFYFGATVDEACLCITKAMTTQCPFDIVQPGKPRDVLPTIFPDSEKLGVRNLAKIELLRKLNPLDSLAALEKQVDLLSDLVLQLANLVPGKEHIALVHHVQQIINDASANAGKSDDQSVASVMSFKKALRQAQADYFAARDGAA